MANPIKKILITFLCLLSLGTMRATETINATYVDLGLPSGTLWANMNLGATSIEDYGDFYCWGETSPKETYTKSNYKWYNHWDVEAYSYVDEDGFTVNVEASTNWGFSKYCWESDEGYKGYTDNLRSLEIDDDAAYAQWGANWRMPTISELRELKEKCTWTWVSLDGINGYKVTGLNGKYIFIPAAGFREDENKYYSNGPIYQRGTAGIYLTKETGSWSSYAASLYFFKDKVDMGSTLFNGQFNGYRMHGLSIRPVYVGTPIQKCKTPQIEFSNGRLNFSSETPNSQFVVTINCEDAKTTSTTSELTLTGVYNIEVHATADGYEKSDAATAKLIWHNGQISSSSIAETYVNSTPILITSTSNEIVIKGDIQGELISVFDLNGYVIYQETASYDVVAIPINFQQGIYLVQIGREKSVKILL